MADFGSNRKTLGIAVISEGVTEKVFYREYFLHVCRKLGLQVELTTISDTPALLISGKMGVATVLFQSMDSVSQMPNADRWFLNVCIPLYPRYEWHVFLCYDTDECNDDVTKFYEGDWEILRSTLRPHAESVVDMAAQADIEDVFLGDKGSILRFLDLPDSTPVPFSKKGKRKLRKLFRLAGQTYHPGDRAKALIESLDMDIVAKNAPRGINFSSINVLLNKLI